MGALVCTVPYDIGMQRWTVCCWASASATKALLLFPSKAGNAQAGLRRLNGSCLLHLKCSYHVLCVVKNGVKLSWMSLLGQACLYVVRWVPLLA
jgi:hypothetical protein